MAALTTGDPTLAGAAFDAMNSDKVDGKHAVGAQASPQQRAGKLVATGATGYPPNNIIKKAGDASLLDGRNSSSYLVTGDGIKVDQQTNVKNCTGATLVSYPVHVSERARIFATASSRYAGTGQPSLEILLRDGDVCSWHKSQRRLNGHALSVSQLLLTRRECPLRRRTWHLLPAGSWFQLRRLRWNR